MLSEITTEIPCEPLKYHIVRSGTLGYLSANLHQECTFLVPPMAPSKPFDHPHPRIAASTAEVEWFWFWAKNARGNRKHSTTTAVTAEIQATPLHKQLALVKATLIPLVAQSPHNCTSFSNQGGEREKALAGGAVWCWTAKLENKTRGPTTQEKNPLETCATVCHRQHWVELTMVLKLCCPA